MSIKEINELFGTSFTLGDSVMVDRDHKSPHIGMVVGTEGCNLKLKLDQHSVVCAFEYDPQDCSIIG